MLAIASEISVVSFYNEIQSVWVSSKYWNNLSNLRKNRFSSINTAFFVTFVSDRRIPWIDQSSTFEASMGFLKRIEDQVSTVSFILMPDHVHWVFEIKKQIELSQIVRMAKFQIRRPVKKDTNRWQKNYFDHRIREYESIESFAHYLFLNPYRRGLIAAEQRWPFWIGNPSFEFRFELVFRELGYVPKEWIGEVKNPLEL